MQKKNEKPKAVIYCRTSGKNQSFETDLELKKLEKKDKSGKISLQIQERECRKIADKFGFEVVEVYQDNNYSCITYPDTPYFRDRAEGDGNFQRAIKNIRRINENNSFRPDFGRMMERVKKKDIHTIIVREETRLMRPLPKSALLLDTYNLLEECNTLVHTAKGNVIDPANFYDFFIMQIVSLTEIQSMMAKIEASKASTIEKRDNGDVYGRLYCFGYD